MTRHYSIAIDGPAGAGKSTVARIVANNLKFEYIDTGSMYRAYTLKILQNNLDPKNQEDVKSILDSTEIYFCDSHIFLDGKMVDEDIRDNRISENVSYIASIKEVRARMVSLQQQMAQSKSVVMDGRDITTVVLPKADFKFFVTASVEERGRRRYLELVQKGIEGITLEKIIEEIKARDEIDSTRKESPLTKTDDSLLVDTTELSIEETVETIINLVKGGI